MIPLLNTSSVPHANSLFKVSWSFAHVLLLILIVLVIFGNALVILAVLIDKKLRTVTTNKFIASLAVSDILVGTIVMPFSLYYKLSNDEWTLGYAWCQFHLVSGVFSTTASIVHLVAISLDRYFAIMFPTEYQRHSVSTSTLPYVVRSDIETLFVLAHDLDCNCFLNHSLQIMIWLMALAVSSTLFMEGPQHNARVCWIENPQYIVLSSFLSFFLPGVIVVYLYIKIFKKLRNHQLYMFGSTSQGKHTGDKRRSLPRVIIEEVRSRRGSRLSQTGSSGGSPTRRGSKERSPSQPDILHNTARPPQRWRSPTICAETLEHDRTSAAKKRVSIVPDPPSMDVSCNMSSIEQMKDEHMMNRMREEEMNDPLRKQSEEEVRKLSEERKIKIAEKRRMSTQDNPNGLPIMQAFQKAYNDVRNGRRRSSIQEVEISYHFPTLAGVAEDASPGSAEKKLSSESSIAETVIALHRVSPVLLNKDDSHDESVSTDASQKPLLSVPSNCYKKKPIPCIPPPTFLMVPAMMSLNTPPLSPNLKDNCTLKVPRLFDCPSPCSVPSNSSHSSYTSASGSSDTYRRISMNSYGSSLTDATDSTFEIDSRRSSAWSTLRAAVLDGGKSHHSKSHQSHHSSIDITIEGTNGTPQKKISTISRGKLRRIATQVTRAIRRKRRESMAIRRESRATRVVAAILLAFLICWIPYFCVSVLRGILTGFRFPINEQFHIQLFVSTSWLGYAHSCFNPVIYMCLNKNFRATMKRLFSRS